MTARLVALAALLAGCATTQLPPPQVPGVAAALRALGGHATHVETLDGLRHGGTGVRVEPDSVRWDWRGGTAALPHCAVGALVSSAREDAANRGAAVGVGLGVAGGLAFGVGVALGAEGPEGERLHPLLRVGLGVAAAVFAVPALSMGTGFVGAGAGYGVGGARRAAVVPDRPACPAAVVTTGVRAEPMAGSD